MHIGIVPDGNRRWEQKNGLSEHEGHIKGLEVMKDLLEYIDKKHPEISGLTLYAMSLDNLHKRNVSETRFLLSQYFINLMDFDKSKANIRIIGDNRLLPDELRKLSQEFRPVNGRRDINLLIAYSNERIDYPIDLVIRTGQYRLSGFPIDPYTIIKFADNPDGTSMLWPDFTVEYFEEVLRWYQLQKQNYGE